MQRYFIHIVTFTFIAFSILHIFLDENSIGPMGLWTFALINYGIFYFNKFFPSKSTLATYLSMTLLVLAIIWYLPANKSNMQSPAIMVALVFPGVVYYLLGLKHGLVWNLIIFLVYSFFIFGDTNSFMELIPLWPTVRADRILVDYWIVFSTMLSISFFIAYIIVRQRSQLDLLIKTDKLTGVLNRHGLIEEIEKVIYQYSRYKKEFSVLIIDADHFKKINDTHGHNIGDKVLINLAAGIKNGLRANDVVGRWGGEEFIVVLPDTSAINSEVVAERVRSVVEQLQITNDTNNRVPVTISIGLSHVRPDINLNTVDAIVGRADEALYLAKKLGRNQVAVAQ
jgi:diguanylate cyclase (GGDEF)-like protein